MYRRYFLQKYSSCPLVRETQRRTIKILAGFLIFTSAWTFSCAAEESSGTHDVIVYGGTPAGCAAAMSAADAGRTVLLVEPTSRLGGMLTNGLSHTDFRTFESLTGLYLRFTQRVQDYYVATYGEGSPQTMNFRGTHAEPKVNLLVLKSMLADRPRILVLEGNRLDGVTMNENGDRIVSIRVTDDKNRSQTFAGGVFIDGSYEGDLMAAAGVPYHVGREGRDEYNESLAPETEDDQVQGYNFRLIMTTNEANRVPPLEPPGYDRADFVDVLPLLKAGKIRSVFARWSGCLYKAQLPELPNGKYDINDVSHGLVRLSLPQINNDWTDGDVATRQRIFDEHVRHNVGLLYFMQTDSAVPATFREEALRWGFCKDEFTENNYLPLQLYVREARRMMGAYIFTENDTNYAEGDARSVLRTDAIAQGDYGPNCHGTGHKGPRIGGKHTGEFYKKVAPYQIRYAVLTPRKSDCVNLLSPGAPSSSHVGFCALRLEPIWMSLGEAAGYAAAIAVGEKLDVQDVPVEQIQDKLHSSGAATIYVTDVLPGHSDFAAVQWWGTLGGLHGLAPTPEEPGQRGKQLDGQYYEAYPSHAAQLDSKLEEAIRTRWNQLAEKHGVTSDETNRAATRGAFIRAAYKQYAEAQ